MLIACYYTTHGLLLSHGVTETQAVERMKQKRLGQVPMWHVRVDSGYEQFIMELRQSNWRGTQAGLTRMLVKRGFKS